MLILFPGLGANQKMYEQYDFDGRKSQVINFLVPFKNETLQNYCKRTSVLIPQNEELIFIGVSFGGILAQEISKIIPAKKIILISTIKSSAEKPRYFSLFKIFPVYKIIPTFLIKYLAIFSSKFFTNKNNEERQLFKSMVMQSNSRVIRYGIHQVLHWKQQQPISNCIHIHGSADHIFPIKKIKADYVIDSGTHFMIIHQRKQINALLNQLLGEIV